PSVAATPTITTTYTISGTGANGCTNSTLQTITVNGCMGLVAITKNGDLGIYPNPGDGTFTLTIPSGSAGNYSIEIRNAISQVGYSDKIQVSANVFQKSVTIPDV